VIKSTVVPGTTLKIKSILQKSSRKKCYIEFGLLTNPEFLREGNAIDDTLNPHIIVIGGEKQNEILKLKNFYKSLHKSKIPFVTTNFQTAELIKYANNSFLATKISFINQIANICQSIPGTNVDDIAKAIGYDPRIGTQFLSAGPGFGGSCLPKDLQTLIAFSTKLGQEPDILKGVQKTNSEQVINLTQMIRKLKRKKRKKITILGLAFKENSDDIRESVSIKLIKKLLKYNYKITVHDPKAMSNVKELFNDKINYSLSIADALKDSECVVIMTSCYEYKHLKKNDFNVMKNKIIIDTRRIIDGQKMNIEYHALGLGHKKIPLSRSN